MGLKLFLKNFKLTSGLYAKLREHKYNRLKKLNLKSKYKFQNRSKGSENLCIILAGYKEFAYPAVFGRIEAFAPENIDICVVSSGLFSVALEKICTKNNWSYLSVKRNNVSLAQNIAINLHTEAKYIFKLDEDIFITENYFSNMLSAYEHACQGDYVPGVIAPLLNVNGYGHLRILEKLNLKEDFAKKFEKPKYISMPYRQIENNFEVAKYFWDSDIVPSIDVLNKKFSSEAKEEHPCAIRFSIGAILFKRELWEEMGYFKVCKNGCGLGDDEAQLCSFCVLNSMPIMVSENVVAGHLSFGKQNVQMKEFYLNNTEKFIV